MGGEAPDGLIDSLPVARGDALGFFLDAPFNENLIGQERLPLRSFFRKTW